MNLLVVDWDYFWPVMEPGNPKLDSTWVFYDWGHSETSELAPFLYEAVWYGRAAGFVRAKLPLPETTGLEKTFWKRFRFAPTARLFFANSNVQAYNERVRRGMNHGDQLWLFDAHHDSGGYRYNLIQTMKREHVECEDWMVPYAFRGVDLHMRYPRWRDYGLTCEPDPIVSVDRQVDDEAAVDVTFNRVFVCKSGAWTPAWGDEQYTQFLAACPVRGKRTCLDGLGPRAFDMEVVQRMQDEMQEALKRFETDQRTQSHDKESQS